MIDFVLGIFFLFALVASPILLLVTYLKFRKQKKVISEKNEEIQSQIKLLGELREELNDSRNVEQKIREAMEDEVRESKEKADKLVISAEIKAGEIVEEAHENARRVAGEALALRDKASVYKKTVEAFKNTIEGYGDEYLIPNSSLVDDIADEYDHTVIGQQLKDIKKKIKAAIKGNKAAECEYVEANRRKTAIEFVLDAFNGKVDTILAKTKHDNYGTLKAMLRDSYSIVNHNGQAFRNAHITSYYLELNQEQLKLAVMVKELKRKDQEEQKAIRDQMREEEKALRDYEKAKKEAEKEEKLAKKALEIAEDKIRNASEHEKAELLSELEVLKQKLAEAEDRGQRALSMAQQTKRGHVYVISNIGSFGSNVYKIGLTRRLDPMDRVKELGDASVPFPFDVHAMIFSEDAPALETELHQVFRDHELNRINPRKEFFDLDIALIKSRVEELGHSCHWTIKAEAQEYRESVKVSEKPMPEAEVA